MTWESWEIFLSKNHAENEAGRLGADIFSVFKKALYDANVSGQQLSFNKIW